MAEIDHLIRSADPRLLQNNHVLSGTDKQVFIQAEPQLVYEIRRSHALIEMMYWAKPNPSDGRFLRQALRLVDDGVEAKGYPFALPIQPPVPDTPRSVTPY